MHTRQSGAAHVNIFFFLVMLVLFLGALGFAYVTLEENNQLLAREAAATSRADKVEAQLYLYRHYTEDLAEEVGETGEYAGREGFDYSEFGSPQPLQNVSVPARVRTAMVEFARSVGVPDSRPLSSLFGLVTGKVGEMKQQMQNLESQKATAVDETEQLKTEVAQLRGEQQRQVETLNAQIRQKTDDYTAARTEAENRITAQNQEYNALREQMSDKAVEHAQVLAEMRRQNDTLGARIDAASEKVKLLNPGQSPDGMVLDASQATGLAWINLGRLDMLPIGTTFEVIKPGSGEVKAFATVRRLEPTRAEVRITGLKDRFDPVMPGDMVRNDLFSPDMRHNIYLMGRFAQPFTRPMVKTLLENLGNRVVDELGPGVDLILVGSDSINADASGFTPITESPEYELAKFLRIEMAPLSKVQHYLKLTNDDIASR